MIPGLRTTLLPHDYLASAMPSAFRGRLGEAERDVARRRFRMWWHRSVAAFGPASSVRAIADRAAIPLVTLLGFSDARVTAADAEVHVVNLRLPDDESVVLLVTYWNRPLDGVWGDAVRGAIAAGADWALCFNGRQLRAIDSRRTWARRFLEFDLESTIGHDEGFDAFWSLLRAAAFAGGAESVLEDAVRAAERHTSAVCGSLQAGVRTALVEICGELIDSAPRFRHAADRAVEPAFEQALTIVYRVLFLLFAEARRLVPVWHPTYRESYTIDALRRAAENRLPIRGVWEALQAITRLAHQGCDAGDLKVAPFNGRLFAPERTPLGNSAAVSDGAAVRAVLALTTRATDAGAGRRPIAYGDLGVEQLGAVYERVLDFEPAARARGAPLTLVSTGRRKATGTFYTPRAITDYLVRRTLHPLAHDASTEQILRLRVLDPAMGSGAFLVSACRFLASAYEAAAVREGLTDVTDADRAGFRRAIAQRCLYGVDLNPMAVQLARLSLWLTTLAAGRPLGFLDHHLRVGNSLIGASIDDLARQRPPGAVRYGRSTRGSPLPLFDVAELQSTLQGVLPLRHLMGAVADDTIEAVRQKEQTLDRLAASDSPLSRWKAAADIWCACWFWSGPAPSPGVFAAMTDAVLAKHSSLPAATLEAWREPARVIADAQRFFHWTLEFPEVFFDGNGAPASGPGFDAVLGNPPWDVVRADSGEAGDRQRHRAAGAQLVRFVRDSGIYRCQQSGHPNRYQLFVDRALSLLKRGGRLGLVVPSGLATDRGSAAIRRYLITRCETDTLVGFENRRRIFPIHRSVKFLLLNVTTGGRTERLRCRFGERDPATLDALPDSPGAGDDLAVELTPALLARISGPDLTIPEIRTRTDLALVGRLFAAAPAMSSPAGWHVRFGRELNATDDRQHFLAKSPRRKGHGDRLLPVIEGKQISPFVCRPEAARSVIARRAAATLLDERTSFGRARLAYRDVASATNRLTLIAAVVPPGVVTTHTLFCLKSDVDEPSQWFLCALLNSYVANYLVRLRVSTHVGVAAIEQLPAPRPSASSVSFRMTAALAEELSLAGGQGDDRKTHARIQACVAHLYGLTQAEFSHVLSTFPLVDPAERDAAGRELAALCTNGTLQKSEF